MRVADISARGSNAAPPPVSGAEDAHLFTLDLMRFAAAVFVVLYHFGTFGFATPVQEAPPARAAFPWLHDYSWFGWIGVQVFFTLSGYIIAKSALRQTPAGFLKGRAVRIFPALWLGTAMAFAIRLIWGEPLSQLLPAVLKSALLLPKGPYIDGVVWTLVVEAVFYLVITGLLMRSGPVAARIARFRAAALVMGLGSAIFVFALGLAYVFGPRIDGHALTALMGWFPLKVVLLHHGVFFALGMLIWLHQSGGLTRRARIALVVIVAGCLLQIALKNLKLNGFGRDPLVPLLIWGAETLLVLRPDLLNPRGLGRRAGATLRFLGLMTYPLYLGHFVLGMYGVPLLSGYFTRGSGLFLAVCLGLVGALAAVVTWGPERWVQALMRRALALPPRGARRAADRALPARPAG